MMKCRMSDGSTAILVFDDMVPLGSLNEEDKATFDIIPSPLPVGQSETPPESVNMRFKYLNESSSFEGAKVNAQLKYDSWVWDEETQDASYVIKMYVGDVSISDIYTFIQGDENLAISL